MIRKSIFFVFLVCGVLVLAGCSSVDCSTLDTTYEKYSEVGGECVAKKIDRNVCGNSVPEEGEGYCSCPEDVQKSDPNLGCEGTKGDYLEKMCSDEDECVLKQNDKVVPQKKSVDFKNSDVYFKGDFVINVPFIINSEDDNKVSVELEYFKQIAKRSEIKDLTVKNLIIKNSNLIEFAEIVYNQKVTQGQGYTFRKKEFEIADTTKPEIKESLKAELIISYTIDRFNSRDELQVSEDKLETLVASLGSWRIINANHLLDDEE